MGTLVTIVLSDRPPVYLIQCLRIKPKDSSLASGDQGIPPFPEPALGDFAWCEHCSGSWGLSVT
jgi:hypothetical protein